MENDSNPTIYTYVYFLIHPSLCLPTRHHHTCVTKALVAVLEPATCQPLSRISLVCVPLPDNLVFPRVVLTHHGPDVGLDELPPGCGQHLLVHRRGLVRVLKLQSQSNCSGQQVE